MKKRVLSLLLVVAMLASLVVFPAYAADTDLCPCGCGETNIEWKTWTGTADPASGHYRLESDLLAEKHINIGNSKNLDAKIVLDLNGHVWRSAESYLVGIGTSTSSSITMDILDSVGGGEMQAYGANDSAGVVMLQSGDTLNLHSGTIRQLYSADITTTIGALYVMNATVNMTGGKITDGYTTNAASAGTYAGNVLLRGTETVMNMSGGEIVNGYSTVHGGGVTVFGTLNMTGGKIYNNATEGQGGNIYVAGSGTANFDENAEVVGGVASFGGNIYNAGTTTLDSVTGMIDGDIYTSSSSLALVGTVNIPMGNSNGIMIKEGETLDLSQMETDSVVFFGVNLTSGEASATVDGLASATFTTNGGDAYADCFRNVGRTTSFAAVDGELVAYRYADNAGGDTNLGDTTTKSWCPHCDEYVEWKRVSLWSATSEITHYYNYNHQSAKSITGTFVVDMSGYTLSRTAQLANTGAANAKIVILDTVGGAQISTTCTSSGAISQCNKAGATVEFWSGTLTGTPTRGMFYVTNGTFIMKGGIIKDSKTTTTNGGAICGNATAANIQMTNGLISNCAAGAKDTNDSGGAINAPGALTITGGIIQNCSADYYGAVYMSGTCDYEISNAIIRGGKAFHSTYGYGGNICIKNAYATLTLENVTIAGGTSEATYGGNIGVATASPLTMTDCHVYGGNAASYGGNIAIGGTGAVSLTNCNLYGGSAATHGGSIGINAGADITLAGCIVYGGNATTTGGNISVAGSSLSDVSLTDCNVSGGAAGTNGGNIWVERALTFAATNCDISDGYAAASGGNVYLRNNIVSDTVTFTDCVISDGSAGDLTNDVDYRSDNVWTGVGVTLDNTKIYGTSGLNNIGSGLRLQNNGSTHTEAVYVTLKGDTQIGTAEHPFDASLSIAYGSTGNPAKLVIDESFTGSAVLSADGLMGYHTVETTAEDGTVSTTYVSDFDANDVYGKTLVDASCTGAFTGKLYLGDHKDSSLKVYEYGMPAITTADGATLVVDAAGAIVNGKHYDLATALGMVKDKETVLKAVATDLTLEEGTYYIDVNGKNVNVTGSGTVYGIDSATDDHENVGTGTLVAAEGVTVKAAATNPVTGDVYVRTVDTEKYEFHHIDMDITSVVLRTGNAGVYYKGTWACDEELAAYIAEQNDNILYGVVASVDNMPENSFDTDIDDAGDNLNCWSYASGADFTSGSVVNGALITGIMKEDYDAAVNTDNASMIINAKAYLMVTEDDGTESYIVGKTGANKSLMDMLVKIDSSLAANTGDLTAQGDVTTLMNNFYNTWKDLGLQAAIDAQDHTFTKVCCTPAVSDEGTVA